MGVTNWHSGHNFYLRGFSHYFSVSVSSVSLDATTWKRPSFGELTDELIDLKLWWPLHLSNSCPCLFLFESCRCWVEGQQLDELHLGPVRSGPIRSPHPVVSLSHLTPPQHSRWRLLCPCVRLFLFCSLSFVRLIWLSLLVVCDCLKIHAQMFLEYNFYPHQINVIYIKICSAACDKDLLGPAVDVAAQCWGVCV